MLRAMSLNLVEAKTRIAELEVKQAKARQRINELEAQVTAADTVSRAEYDALVKQRDTLRQERNAAINERDTERIRANAFCEALEVARGALHDATADGEKRSALVKAVVALNRERAANSYWR